MPKDIEHQGISFCTRWTDVLNYVEYNKASNTKYYFNNKSYQIRLLQANLTIKQVFDFTPKAEDLINEVQFRKGSGFQLLELSRKSEIQAEFEVSRYLFLEYICYKINKTVTEDHSYRSLAVTPAAPGLVMFFKISKVFDRSSLIKISLHESGIYPERSLDFIPVFNRNHNSFKEFVVSVSKLTSYLKETPYETDCFDYDTIGLRDETVCAHRCIKNKTLDYFDKLPFNVFINEDDEDKKTISYNDVVKETQGRVIKEIQDDCYDSVCRRIDCSYSISLTKTSVITGDELIIRHVLQMDPNIIIDSSAKFSLLEFITYMLSVVSTWTGAAIMDLRPMKVGRKLKSKMMTFKRHDERRKKKEVKHT
jgi:hypothetical protein